MRHPYFDLPTPLAIGHRGAAGEAPENTLVSFARALEVGAAILESDVHLTRDGVPVLLHDDEVDRNTEGSGRVAEHDFASLQKLDAGYRFTPDGGASFPFRGQSHRVPSLEEAFAAFPGARFNLELKEQLPGLVENTIALVERAGRQDLTLLTAGEDPLMAELRSALQRRERPIAQGACLADVLDFIRSAQDGGTPQAGPMALQIPDRFGSRPLVTKELVEHAHAHGVQIHVWTVNEPAEMHRLFDLGVDGIVSDFPDRVARVIAERRV